jgi:hypothetical protein
LRISVPLKPDEENMLGRQCPKKECLRYFKVKVADYTTFMGDELFCPYCGKTDHPDSFLTQDQLEYAKSMALVEVLEPLLQELKSLEMKPERQALLSLGIKVDIKDLRVKQYFEKESRRSVTCENCGRGYSIYGVSYYCPFCGPRSPIAVYRENIETIRNILSLSNRLSDDRDLVQSGKVRELTEEGIFDTLVEGALDKTVTAFETYCKSRYASEMVKRHQNSSHEDWLERAGNKFQNLDRAEELLNDDLRYSICAQLSDDEKKAVRKGLQTRHVLIHNSGIVDRRYVKETGESTSLVGTRVHVGRAEVEQLAATLTRLVESIEKTI